MCVGGGGDVCVCVCVIVSVCVCVCGEKIRYWLTSHHSSCLLPLTPVIGCTVVKLNSDISRGMYVLVIRNSDISKCNQRDVCLGKA